MIRRYLNGKRANLIIRELEQPADLDVGCGKAAKGAIRLDWNSEFRPDIVADIRFLPLKNMSVRSVVCSHIIEHVESLDEAIIEVQRVLVRSGVSIFFLPDYGSRLWRLLEPLWDAYYSTVVSARDSPRTHVHFFDSGEFGRYMRRFFSDVKVRRFNLGMEIMGVCSGAGPAR